MRSGKETSEIGVRAHASSFVVVSLGVSAELKDRRARSVLVLCIAWAAMICCSLPAIGETAVPSYGQEPQAQQSKPERQDPDYNGEDFTRPQSSFETRFLYQTSSGTTSQTDRGTLLLRANWKTELDAGWRLGLLGQIPVVDKTTFDPTGADREFGIGDTAFQAALIRDIDRHWAFGFGARLVAPTAEDSLGSGKWQIMPGFGVRYSFLEIGPDTYFVPVVRYAISFAGDPSRRNISEPQIAPTLNIGLPDRWFVTFYPNNDIRINFGDPIPGQTGCLFLPFDVSVGRKITDGWTISLEASVPIINDYPVYNFKTELRIVKQF
ncbi:MAG: transporter [Xanthobacteraceae bacterium]